MAHVTCIRAALRDETVTISSYGDSQQARIEPVESDWCLNIVLFKRISSEL